MAPQWLSFTVTPQLMLFYASVPLEVASCDKWLYKWLVKIIDWWVDWSSHWPLIKSRCTPRGKMPWSKEMHQPIILLESTEDLNGHHILIHAAGRSYSTVCLELLRVRKLFFPTPLVLICLLSKFPDETQCKDVKMPEIMEESRRCKSHYALKTHEGFRFCISRECYTQMPGDRVGVTITSGR